MRNYLFLICVIPLLCIVTGCGAAHVATSDCRTDSTRIEVRIQHTERIDTVLIEIPKISESVTTVRDTVSRLENDYSRSVASIQPDGHLYHTLETKPGKIPVAVVTTKTTRDSIIYRDREVCIEKPVEVARPRSTFEKIEIWGFWLLLAAAVLYIIIRLKSLL